MFVLLGLFSVFVAITNAECDVSKEPDVKQFDIRIPEIILPKNLTYYVCQQFEVPHDDDYNAIGFEGLIGNPGVVHHILLFGCDFDVEVFEPHECGNYDGQCRSWLAQWTIGVDGKICTYNDTGIRFGKNSYKYMSLQIHWNNNNLEKNQTDTSGIRLYYTKHMRNYEVGNVQIGQNDLEIPAGSRHLLQSGSCSSTCTKRMLPHPIYLTKTYIHMHNMAVEGKFEIYRNGNLVREVAHDAVYNYHKSPIHYHEPPVEVKPGDEVKLSCWFSSGGRNHTVYWGEGSDLKPEELGMLLLKNAQCKLRNQSHHTNNETWNTTNFNAEMCYAFVTYYPKVPGFDQCIQFDKYDVNCHLRGESYMGGCSMESFEVELKSSLTENILKNCQSDLPCGETCTKNLLKLSAHPCYHGRFQDYSNRLFPSRLQHWSKLMKLLELHKSSCPQ